MYFPDPHKMVDETLWALMGAYKKKIARLWKNTMGTQTLLSLKIFTNLCKLQIRKLPAVGFNLDTPLKFNTARKVYRTWLSCLKTILTLKKFVAVQQRMNFENPYI